MRPAWKWSEPAGDEPPLRAELFSTLQMEQHGFRLASSHALTAEPVPDRLLSRLAANERVLLDTCRQLTEAVAMRDRAGAETELEASGGVNLETVAEIAKTGVDYISVGALTHSVRSIDLGLDLRSEDV